MIVNLKTLFVVKHLQESMYYNDNIEDTMIIQRAVSKVPKCPLRELQ